MLSEREQERKAAEQAEAKRRQYFEDVRTGKVKKKGRKPKVGYSITCLAMSAILQRELDSEKNGDDHDDPEERRRRKEEKRRERLERKARAENETPEERERRREDKRRLKRERKMAAEVACPVSPATTDDFVVERTGCAVVQRCGMPGRAIQWRTARRC